MDFTPQQKQELKTRLKEFTDGKVMTIAVHTDDFVTTAKEITSKVIPFFNFVIATAGDENGDLRKKLHNFVMRQKKLRILVNELSLTLFPSISKLRISEVVEKNLHEFTGIASLISSMFPKKEENMPGEGKFDSKLFDK